jgi:hypothetical protein
VVGYLEVAAPLDDEGLGGGVQGEVGYLEVAAPLDDKGLGGGVQGEQGRGLQGREGAQVDDRSPLTEKSFHYRMTAPREGTQPPGAYPGGMHRMHVHPPSPPLCIPPPGHVHPPPPQPERLVMRKDEAVGNKKKMQVCYLNIIIN